MKAKKLNSYYLRREGNFNSTYKNTPIYFCQYSYAEELGSDIKHIIIQHGAYDYHKRYEDLIVYLLETFKENILISCMNLIGHGYSGGSRVFVNSFDDYIEDFLKFVRVDTDFYHDRKVSTHIIAQSLGAVIALKTLIDKSSHVPFKIDSLILINPCIKPKLYIPPVAKGIVGKLINKIGKFRVSNIYTGKDITTDNAKAIEYDTDELISNFATVKFIDETLKATEDIMRCSYFIDFPCLFLLSDKDKLVDSKVTDLFISSIDKNFVKVLKYSNTMHDILNEKCATLVFKEIKEYIDIH